MPPVTPSRVRSAHMASPAPDTVTSPLGGGDGDGGLAADQHPGAVAVPDEDEARERADAPGEQAVEHLVEVGAAVDQLPEAGDARALVGGEEQRDAVAEDGVPVPLGRASTMTCGLTHGRAPNLSSRLASWRSESYESSCTNPTTSMTTAVALSRPPASRAAARGRRRRPGDRGRSRGWRRCPRRSIMPVMPSLQSRSRSTAGSGSRKKSGRTPSGLPSARVITCRSGWTDGLLGGDRPGVDELLDDRVVDADLVEPAVVEAVDAGVAEVDEQPLGGCRRRRRARPPRQVVPACQRGCSARCAVAVLDDPDLRPGEGVGDLLGTAARVVALLDEPGELLDHDPAGDVATGVPAHAVGHDEHRRRDEEGVLVDLADVSDVGGGSVVQIDRLHALSSPSSTMSPGGGLGE